jgi:hypothetical protein
VETAPGGRGSRFVVELPCADVDGIADTAPSAVA